MTERVYFEVEDVRAKAAKSLEMAVYAEAIGAAGTARYFRGVAMHFSNIDLIYRKILKEGYTAKRRRRR
ncbi:MAG: hypothetical protein JJ902_23635 [Roseibium sp.]|nr:hypothetical protein [Roseibium sp.]